MSEEHVQDKRDQYIADRTEVLYSREDYICEDDEGIKKINRIFDINGDQYVVSAACNHDKCLVSYSCQCINNDSYLIEYNKTFTNELKILEEMYDIEYDKRMQLATESK